MQVRSQVKVSELSIGEQQKVEILKALFRGCSYTIKKTRAFGKDEFDLVRASSVALEIEWKECSGVETFIPSTFFLELDEGKWRIMMHSEEEPAPGQEEDKGEAPELEPLLKDLSGAQESKEVKP